MYDLSGVTILGVEGSPTKTGGTRFKVKLSNGTEPSTFNQEEATKAHQLTGQVVDVRLEQSGKYTNFVAAGPVGTLPALALPGGTAIPMGGTTSAAPGATPIPTGTSSSASSYKRDPQVERRIVAQSSLKTALDFYGSLYTGSGPEAANEALAAAKTLAKELFDLVFIVGDTEAPTSAQTLTAGSPAYMPQDVATQVNEVLGGAAVAVGMPATPSGVAW